MAGLGGGQQRLRGDAAGVHTRPANGGALDHYDRFAQIGGADGRAESAAAGADDGQIEIRCYLRQPTAHAGTAGTELRLESAAFLRYQRAFVAASADPLGRQHGPVAVTQLLARPWFAGPAGIQDSTEEGRWLSSMAVAPDIIRLSSETDALAAVRAGEGIMLALGHIVRAEIQSGALVRLAVVGTPVSGLWWASTLDHRRATTRAQTLKRFVGTADATAAMVAPRGLERRSSKFHVALWSK